MRKEIWMPVLGYEGLYEASNTDGKIRSLNYNKTGKIRVLSTGHSGKYDRIHLYKEGKVKSYLVHRLVWEAFNGPIPEGMQVNHIDENPKNNNLENLNLMTPMENINWGTGIERRWATRQNTDDSKELDNRRKYMKEYSKKYAPEYRKKNQEHINELQRKRRAANREEENLKQNEYRKRYRQEHLEEVRAKAREKYRRKKEVA